MIEWIKGIPEDNRNYLASFVNRIGKRRTIKAFYARRFTIEGEGSEEANEEYHEDNDCYYLIEGWYEVIENWSDFSSIYVVEGDVSHYMIMPKPLEDNTL